MDWQDDEFEAFLRQFRPRRPKALPDRRRAVMALAAAAAVALAVSLPLRSWWTGRVDGVMPDVTPASSAPSSPANPAVRSDQRVSTAAVDRVPQVDIKLAQYSSQNANGARPAGDASEQQVVMSVGAVPPRAARSAPSPQYPAEAARLGLEGHVELRLTVNPAGDVTRAERIRSSMNLRPDEPDGAERVEYYAKYPFAFAVPAEQAARTWKFDPAPSTMTLVVSFAFNLKEPSELEKGSSGASGLPTITPVPGLPRPGPPPSAAAANAGGGAAAGRAGVRRLRVGGAVRPPLRIINVNPVYPPEAQAAGVSGVVIIEAVIGTDGSVIETGVLRSIPELDDAALEAVSQWHYEPTLLNGEPVELEITVTVNFTLR
jgi:TonB family protein